MPRDLGVPSSNSLTADHVRFLYLPPLIDPPLHSPPHRLLASPFLPSILVRCRHYYLSMSSGVPSPPAPANKIGEATLPTPVSSPPSTSWPWPWQGMQSNFHDFLKSEVDPELSAIPLA